MGFHYRFHEINRDLFLGRPIGILAAAGPGRRREPVSGSWEQLGSENATQMAIFSGETDYEPETKKLQFSDQAAFLLHWNARFEFGCFLGWTWTQFKAWWSCSLVVRMHGL